MLDGNYITLTVIALQAKTSIYSVSRLYKPVKPKENNLFGGHRRVFASIEQHYLVI